MLTMPINNCNVSSVKEPTSSTDLAHNGYPQNSHNTKKNKNSNVFVYQEGVEFFFLKFNCIQNSLDDRIEKKMKVVENSKLQFTIF